MDWVAVIPDIGGLACGRVRPCMLNQIELIISSVYRGGCSALEAGLSDLVCRVAPRLIAQFEEYQEALYNKYFASQGRTKHQVRGRGAGDYSDLFHIQRGSR